MPRCVRARNTGWNAEKGTRTVCQVSAWGEGQRKGVLVSAGRALEQGRHGRWRKPGKDCYRAGRQAGDPVLATACRSSQNRPPLRVAVCSAPCCCASQLPTPASPCCVSK